MIKNPPIIKKVVEEMGGTFEKLIPERGYFYINIKGRRIFVSRKFKISSNLISGSELTKFKDLTYRILEREGLPTPKTVCFYKRTVDRDGIKSKLEQLSFPIVIKDAKGSNSKGVFTDIRDVDEASKIIIEQLDNFDSLLAQEMVYGKEYRVLILKNRVIGALEMIPPRIFGDGRSTIKELIEKKQSKTQRRTPLDQALSETLASQHESLDSIPEKDKEVRIKNNSCLAEGGETRDVTDSIHPEIRDICVKATRSMGKYLSGIDIMCDDASEGITEQNFSIIEINGKPDLYIHYDPTHGKTRNVIKDIINFILELDEHPEKT